MYQSRGHDESEYSIRRVKVRSVGREPFLCWLHAPNISRTRDGRHQGRGSFSNGRDTALTAYAKAREYIIRRMAPGGGEQRRKIRRRKVEYHVERQKHHIVSYTTRRLRGGLSQDRDVRPSRAY